MRSPQKSTTRRHMFCTRTDNVRGGHTATHEARNSSRNRVRLASARTGKHQHGPERVHDNLLLLGAQAAENGRHDVLGHIGSRQLLDRRSARKGLGFIRYVREWRRRGTEQTDAAVVRGGQARGRGRGRGGRGVEGSSDAARRGRSVRAQRTKRAHVVCVSAAQRCHHGFGILHGRNTCLEPKGARR